MFLKPTEVAALNELRAKIEGQASASEIAATIDALASKVEDKDFPAIYAGVILANQKRLHDACIFLDTKPYHALSSMLSAYLKDTGHFTPQAVCFADSRPYDVFTQTSFYKAHIANTLRIIGAFAKANPPTNNGGKNQTIVDIGSGNGVFIAQVINSLIDVSALESCHLIVIDHSEAMHKATEQYCLDNVKIPMTFSHILGKVQDISQEDLHNSLGKQDIWFINGSLSLHHMPDNDKVRVLGQLKEFSPHLLITDGHANSDTTAKDSPEFVCSVAANYNYYIGNVLEADVSESDKKHCVNDFLLTEAIIMLTNERANRIDYHATTEQWSDYATQAGYKVVKLTPAVAIPKRTITFTLQLRA